MKKYNSMNSLVGFLAFISIITMTACAAHTHGTACPTVSSSKSSAQRLNYPKFKYINEATHEKIFGIDVYDPFRAMEDATKSKQWVEAENELFLKYLQTAPSGFEKELADIFNIGWIGDVRVVGNSVFYIKREGNVEQALLYVRTNGTDKVVVDPNKIDPTGKTSIDWFYPSPDGKLLAYGLSKNGSEDSTLYVIDVNSGKQVDAPIPDTRACSIAWLKDSSGFYYTRYPHGDEYNRMPYFHKLGTEYSKDYMLPLPKPDKTLWTEIDLSVDERYVILAEYNGWVDTDLYLFDRANKKILTIIKDKQQAIIGGIIMKGSKIYIHTTANAPNGKVVVFDLETPKDTKTLIPEDKHSIEGVMFTKNRIYVKKSVDVAERIYIYSYDGKLVGEFEMPDAGMIMAMDADYDTDNAIAVFSSFLYPPSALMIDGESLKPQTVVSVKANIDPTKYVVEQVKYPSYDGTMVNMFIVHKKGQKQDGLAPTLLYGYGGFAVNMSPYFSRRAMFWLSKGGTYAVANIRGGAEYGEEWHRAGMKEKKFQVFKDFEYAMRYLLQHKYTSPDRLAIAGGSNGGLLMGAMITEVPYLFSVALADVGLFDMVRYTKFPPAQLWVQEYGSPKDEREFRILWAYSPYHQVIDGVKYPAFLAMTAESDTRVHWVHSAKMVARLQQATAGDAPILFYLERKAGHGQGKNQSDIIKEYYRKFRFLFANIKGFSW